MTFLLPLLIGLSGQAAASADHWTLNVAPAVCTVSRPLDGAYLNVSTLAGSSYYRVIVAAPGLPRSLPGPPATTGLILHGADRRLDRFATASTLRDGGDPAISFEGLPLSAIQELANSTSVEIVVRNRTFGPFAIPGAGPAMTAFQKCEDDQLVAWGADPAQFDAGGARPAPLKGSDSWLDKDTLLRIAAGGNVDAQYRLGVAADGTIDRCDRLNPGKDKADGIVCPAVLNKHLFEPAHDAGGRRVRGAASFRVQLIVASRRIS